MDSGTQYCRKRAALVRDRKTDEADRLLKDNGLSWARKEDIWLFEGGPGVDTARMNGP